MARPTPRYFDRDEVWTETYWTDLQRERAQQSALLIPDEVSSVLDVGCGAGVVTRELASRCCVVGIDLAFRPLVQLRAAGIPAVRSDARALPTADQSFDLVMATEILEHLPAADLRRALDELLRVARRYLLVTVPYRENLEWSQLKCGNCGLVFHAWGHARSYSEGDMPPLFQPSFRLRKLVTLGDLTKRVPRFLVRLGHSFGGYACGEPGRSICPGCGETERFRSRVWARALWSVPQRYFPLPRLHHWMAALYEKA